jgi:hypothetical protein
LTHAPERFPASYLEPLFGQIHAKRFHRQFLPLDRQDLPALFLAVIV